MSGFHKIIFGNLSQKWNSKFPYHPAFTTKPVLVSEKLAWFGIQGRSEGLSQTGLFFPGGRRWVGGGPCPEILPSPLPPPSSPPFGGVGRAPSTCTRLPGLHPTTRLAPDYLAWTRLPCMDPTATLHGPDYLAWARLPCIDPKLKTVIKTGPGPMGPWGPC